MKVPVRILFSGFLLITVLPASGFVLPPERSGKGSPCYEGMIALPGLDDSVTVFRDGRGMPHIYASSEHDLYLATGYLSAQDRLWQMDLIRRSSAGRLAEIFGRAYTEIDIINRCLQMREKSRLVLQNEDPEILACLQAYADGVNAFISSPGKRLPLEFRLLSYEPEPWTLEDIVSITGLLGWSLGSKNLEDELFNYELVVKVGVEKASELIPDWNIATDVAYPDFTINDTIISTVRSLLVSAQRLGALGVTASSASNNWAVSGRRSETGKPILSNDIHLSLSAPGIWMQMHQVVHGKLDVTGVIIPGEPFIIAGHNERIAWGMTNLMADDIDLYTERINPQNNKQYLFNGEWKDIISKNEIIRIKGGRQDTFVIRFTHRGPLLSDLPGVRTPSLRTKWADYEYLTGMKHLGDIALSMKWSGNDRSDEVRSVYTLNRAAGWDDFRFALGTFRSVSQNFIYADTEGNIGLNAGGGIPLRKGDGIMIRSGETDEYDWKGYVPFEQLPFSYNPDIGQVSSANNKTVNTDQSFSVGQDYWVPYRIKRIRQMLGEKEVFSIEDFKRMINDQHSCLAALLTPYILRLNDRRDELTARERAALDTLSGWDYDMNPALTAPTVFEFFRTNFKRNLLADEMGEIYEHLNYLTGEYYIYRIITERPDEWIDNISTDEVETMDDIVMQSFRDGMESLVRQHGKNPENWKWGKIHTVTFMHPLGTIRMLDRLFKLNSARYGIGGSDHTVSPYFTFKPGFRAVVGASVRHIFNTADWDKSYTIIPGGESGIPHSEFYLSQVKPFLEGKFYQEAFTDTAVRASAKYTLILMPQK
jgi:penicillin amidase